MSQDNIKQWENWTKLKDLNKTDIIEKTCKVGQN